MPGWGKRTSFHRPVAHGLLCERTRGSQNRLEVETRDFFYVECAGFGTSTLLPIYAEHEASTNPTTWGGPSLSFSDGRHRVPSEWLTRVRRVRFTGCHSFESDS